MSGSTIISASGSTLNLTGSGSFVITGSNDIVSFGGGATITIQGNNDTLKISGGNDIVTIQGATASVSLLSGSFYTVTGDAGSDVVTLLGSVAATVNGSGGSIDLAGSGDTLITSNESVGVAAGDQNANITGTGDIIWQGASAAVYVAGGSDTIYLAGTADSVGLWGGNGYIVNTDNAGNSVSLYGSTAATVNGAGGVVNLFGGNNSVSTSNETVGVAAGDQNADITGTGDTIWQGASAAVYVAGGSDVIYMGGASDSTSLLGSGDIVYSDNASDIANLGANTTATIIGVGGGVYLAGSNDSVSTSNETIGTTANDQNENVIGTGNTIYESANNAFNVAGSSNAIDMGGASDSVTLLGSGEVVYNDNAGDVANLGASTTATVTGVGGGVYLAGSNDSVVTSNETIGTTANDQNESVTGAGDTIFESANNGFTIAGGANVIDMGGASDSVTLLSSGDVVYNDDAGDVASLAANTAATVTGSGGGVYLAGSNDSVSTSAETIGTVANDQNESVTGTNNTVFEAANTSVTIAGASNTVDMGGANDVAGLIGGSGDKVYNDAAGDQVSLDATTSAQVMLSGGSVGVDGIDAVYTMVLDRDPTAAEITAAESGLATGGTLTQLQAQLANSAELQSDLASTYAAAGGAAPTLADQYALFDAQNPTAAAGDVPSSYAALSAAEAQAQAPTQADDAAFADALSTTYGDPIELDAVDPGNQIMPTNGARTELADTSATNLLAELPVLETEANGVNLGLTLADGTQLAFTSTSQLATFLYALAVQQMQATSFVTDNYNLDMQWLNTIDQPLLNQAICWSEHAAAMAAAGGFVNNEQAIEFNEGANLALRIAAEAPSSRTDAQVTITNVANGGALTEVTVFASGSGISVHDISQSIGQVIASGLVQSLTESAVIYAAAQAPLLALSFDDGDSSPDTTSSQATQGAVNKAEEVIGAIDGGPSAAAPIATLETFDTQAVGGVYGPVQTAQDGNPSGITDAALQAEAASAAGLDPNNGGQATLDSIQQDLGTLAAGSSEESDFDSGKLGQGLVDSLDGYLTSVAQEHQGYQNNVAQVQGSLLMNDAAFASASDASAAAASIPNFVSTVQAASTQTSAPSDGVGLTVTSLGSTNIVVVFASGASQTGIGSEVVPVSGTNNQGPNSASIAVNGTLVASAFLNQLLGPQMLATPAQIVSVQTSPQTLSSVLTQDINATFDVVKTNLQSVGSDIYDLASNLAAEIKQEIFASGQAPELSGEHGYIFEEGMRFTNPQAGSQFMRNYPGPGIDYSTQGGSRTVRRQPSSAIM